MKKHRAPIDRRDFLLRAGVGLGAFGLGGILDPSEALAAPESRVVVVQGTNIEAMLRTALKVFKGLESIVKGKKVLLKPNMSFKNPAAWGNNTSPEVAAAVAKLLKEAGASSIIAVDHTMGQGGQSLVTCGVQPALEKVGGIQVISAHQRSDYTKLRIPAGKQLKVVEVPKVVTSDQVIISLPVAKQHNATKVSFGLKNLMGLVWDRAHFHEMINLHQGIADLATVLRPALTIIDATRVMVNNGPQGPGKVQKLDTLIVSTDPVAADAVAVGLTQWASANLTPKDIAHIQAAALLGLGVADLAKIKVIKKRA